MYSESENKIKRAKKTIDTFLFPEFPKGLQPDAINSNGIIIPNTQVTADSYKAFISEVTKIYGEDIKVLEFKVGEEKVKDSLKVAIPLVSDIAMLEALLKLNSDIKSFFKQKYLAKEESGLELLKSEIQEYFVTPAVKDILSENETKFLVTDSDLNFVAKELLELVKEEKLSSVFDTMVTDNGLIVTEAQTTYPYISFRDLIKASVDSKILEDGLSVDQGSYKDTINAFKEIGSLKGVVVMDVGVGTPNSTFENDLNYLAKEFGSEDIGPLNLGDIALSDDGDLVARAKNGNIINLEEYSIYSRFTVEEVKVELELAVQDCDKNKVSAIKKLLFSPRKNEINGIKTPYLDPSNPALMAMLGKGNMNLLKNYLKDIDSPFAEAFVTSYTAIDKPIDLPEGSYVVKPVNANSGKGQERVRVLSRESLESLLEAINVLQRNGKDVGFSVKETSDGFYLVEYDQEFEPTEKKFDYIAGKVQRIAIKGTNPAKLKSGVAQRLFKPKEFDVPSLEDSPFKLITELRFCCLNGGLNFMLARVAPSMNFSSGDESVTKTNTFDIQAATYAWEKKLNESNADKIASMSSRAGFTVVGFRRKN